MSESRVSESLKPLGDRACLTPSAMRLSIYPQSEYSWSMKSNIGNTVIAPAAMAILAKPAEVAKAGIKAKQKEK